MRSSISLWVAASSRRAASRRFSAALAFSPASRTALALTVEFSLAGAQLIAQNAAFYLGPVDFLALSSELRTLAGALGLELLDAHLEASRRHGEFGALQTLVGQDFRHRRGIAASNCRLVSRTARPWTSGTTTKTLRVAAGR
jgi:hypothetical protein